MGTGTRGTALHNRPHIPQVLQMQCSGHRAIGSVGTGSVKSPWFSVRTDRKIAPHSRPELTGNKMNRSGAALVPARGVCRQGPQDVHAVHSLQT